MNLSNVVGWKEKTKYGPLHVDDNKKPLTKRRIAKYVGGAILGVVLIWVIYVKSFVPERDYPPLNAGTLLGAVREGGFIKNDRDVDLLSFDAFEYTIEMEIRPEINEKCGVMVNRHDRQWQFPNAFNCRKAAYRVFYSTFMPWYLDIKTMQRVDEDKNIKLLHGNYFYDHRGTEPESFFHKDLIFPLKECEFEGIKVKCPQNSERVLELEYGPDWRTPRSNFVAGDVTREREGNL